jgi:hypothetical protein
LCVYLSFVEQSYELSSTNLNTYPINSYYPNLFLFTSYFYPLISKKIVIDPKRNITSGIRAFRFHLEVSNFTIFLFSHSFTCTVFTMVTKSDFNKAFTEIRSQIDELHNHIDLSIQHAEQRTDRHFTASEERYHLVEFL